MCFSLEEVPWFQLMNASWSSLSGLSQKIASLENALLSEEYKCVPAFQLQCHGVLM